MAPFPADGSLCTPSPGPLVHAELSTIIEADSSGISKHIPSYSPFTDSSSSLPTSPLRVPEQDTIRRPMTSNQLVTPSTSSSPDSTISTNANFPLTHSAQGFATTGEADADLDLELSTSQLATQVQDAMARTSWSGSDGPVTIDADNSFVQQDCQSHSDIEKDEIDISLFAQAGSASPSPSPSTPSFPPGPPGDDDASHINNSLSSVVNPNELCSSSAVRGEQNMTLDLESVDSDLRDAVTRKAHQSHISPTHSSTSGRTVTLSSPQSHHLSPVAQRQSSASGSRSTSADTVPSTFAKRDPLSSGIPHSKRRVASSLLPRLRSPPPSTVIHSAPASARNSSSPQKVTIERIWNVDHASSPKSPVFVAPRANGSVDSASNPVGNVRGGLTASTPAKKAKKHVAQRGHTRVSSVPVMSRKSLKYNAEYVETEEALGPEVKVMEASGKPPFLLKIFRLETYPYCPF